MISLDYININNKFRDFDIPLSLKCVKFYGYCNSYYKHLYLDDFYYESDRF